MKRFLKSNFLMLLLFLPCLLCVVWPANAIGAQDEAVPVPAVEKPEPIITREQTIETRAGERQTIPTEEKILDVAITRPEVADAFITGSRELTFVANSPGVGKIVIHLEGGDRIAFKIRVHVADPEKFAETLREKIGHIQNVDIQVLGGKILVDGRVLYLKDMDEIERALGDNPSIINLTSLSSRNARILAREIERELRESAIYGARVEVRNNRVTLVGKLRSERLVKKAEQIASTYTASFDSLLEVAP